MFRRRQSIKMSIGFGLVNRTVDTGMGQNRLDSPNMSRISPMDTTQKSAQEDDSMVL